jgi:hypothetical protein
MKVRRLVHLWVLLGMFSLFGFSTFAEEGPKGSIPTVMSGTSLHGYVDTSVIWHTPPRRQPGFREWLRRFFLELKC